MGQISQSPANWVEPPDEQQSVRQSLESLRERLWVVMAAMVITTAAAILYVATADKV